MKEEWVSKLVDYVKADVSKFHHNFQPRDMRYMDKRRSEIIS